MDLSNLAQYLIMMGTSGWVNLHHSADGAWCKQSQYDHFVSFMIQLILPEQFDREVRSQAFWFIFTRYYDIEGEKSNLSVNYNIPIFLTNYSVLSHITCSLANSYIHFNQNHSSIITHWQEMHISVTTIFLGLLTIF